MAFFAQGKAGFLCLEEGRRLPADRESEKWGFMDRGGFQAGLVGGRASESFRAWL